MGLTLDAWESLTEAERDLWRTRADKQLGIHTDCGHPRSECADPDLVWNPQLVVCRATMAEQWARERFKELHDKRPWHDGSFPDDPRAWSSKQTARTPYHYQWGTTIFVTTDDPGLGGDFLRMSTLQGVDEVEGGEPENDH